MTEINERLEDNDVQVPRRFAELSDQIRMNIEETNIETGPDIPPLTYPTITIWPPFWRAMWTYSSSERDDMAADYLSRARDAGLRTASLHDSGHPTGNITDQVYWAAEQIRNAGMLVGMKSYSSQRGWPYGSYVLQHRTNDPMEVYHTSYVYDASTDWYAQCPGYVGIRWQKYLERISAFVTAIQPDYVAFSDELFRTSCRAEDKVPGMLAGCSRCGSAAAHDNNLLDREAEITNAIHSIRPGIPIETYGWSRYWSTSFADGPGQTFYFLADYMVANNQPSEAAEMFRQINAGARTCEYTWPANVNDRVRNGYPWFAIYKHSGKHEAGFGPAADDGDTYWGEEAFYDTCVALARLGAYGYGMWTGPYGEWKWPSGAQVGTVPANGLYHNDYWEDKRWAITKAGVDGFRDVYGAAHQSNSLALV